MFCIKSVFYLHWKHTQKKNSERKKVCDLNFKRKKFILYFFENLMAEFFQKAAVQHI